MKRAIDIPFSAHFVLACPPFACPTARTGIGSVLLPARSRTNRSQASANTSTRLRLVVKLPCAFPRGQCLTVQSVDWLRTLHKFDHTILASRPHQR